MQKNLKVKLYADGAELETIEKMAKLDWVAGFTTNPTLMRKSGATDYKDFAISCLNLVGDKPISFEVFADDEAGMIAQALVINSWGGNVYVKIPVMNTKGESTSKVIKNLADQGVKLNVTAVFTLDQVKEIISNLKTEVPAIISIFAGRIADTGGDPMPIMREAKAMMRDYSNYELLWASPREVLNVMQAEEVCCDIITATSDILSKLKLFGKDLHEYSLETVQMFYNDAKNAGFEITI
jgi:transaldolase